MAHNTHQKVEETTFITTGQFQNKIDLQESASFQQPEFQVLKNKVDNIWPLLFYSFTREKNVIKKAYPPKWSCNTRWSLNKKTCLLVLYRNVKSFLCLQNFIYARTGRIEFQYAANLIMEGWNLYVQSFPVFPLHKSEEGCLLTAIPIVLVIHCS